MSTSNDNQLTEAMREPVRRGDWVFYLVAGALILFMANYMTLRGYLMEAPEGMAFTGTVDPHQGDLFYHLSLGTQVARGELLLEQKYNGDKIRTRWLVNVLALAIGAMMWLGLSPEVASHVLRNLMAAAMLLVLYHLCAQVLLRRKSRRLAFLVASLGSGLAWLIGGLNHLLTNPGAAPGGGWTTRPGIDSPLRSFTLDGRLMELSHFRLISTEFVAPSVMMLILLFWLRFPRPGSWRSSGAVLKLGLIPLFIGLTHPHDIVNIAAACLLLLLWGMASTPRPPWVTPRVVLLGLPAAPIYVVHWLMMNNEPVLAPYFMIQDMGGTLAMFVGLGLPGLVAAARFPWLLRSEWAVRVLAVASVSCFLLYSLRLPGTGQWYNIHALQVFASLLAVTALERIRAPRIRRAGGVVMAAMVLLAPGNIVMHMAEDISRLELPWSPHFRAKELNQTLGWMYRNLSETSVVLTDLETVVSVPHSTGCRVFIGQPEQTKDYPELARELGWWQKAPANPRLPYLRKHGVTHILQTPKFTDGLTPSKIPALVAAGALKQVHAVGKYALFEVVGD